MHIRQALNDVAVLTGRNLVHIAREPLQLSDVTVQPVLFTLLFGLGAMLAALSGLLAGPVFSVTAGMGDGVLILAIVVIVIGGIGSIRGAFVAALFVGLADTLGRAFLPEMLRLALSQSAASTAAPALSSMLIYLLMAIVLVLRPEGLFPATRR